MRSRYWSCSKFADWLRGTAKPGAATGRGWNEWKQAAQDTHPIRYWIVEEGLDYLQNIWMWIPDRINDVLAEGAVKARKVAQEVLGRVRERLGMG
jgi:hypothetical protein